MSNHVAHQLLLELTVEPWHILVEPLISSASLDHGLPSLKVTIVSIWSNKIQVLLYVNYWNRDVLIVDAHRDILI